MNMSSPAKPKALWLHRFAIQFFTVLFAILVFWILGFFVRDIRSIESPDYAAIEKTFLDRKLVQQKLDTEKSTQKIRQELENKRAEMKIVRDSSRNLQKTINQLIELKKLSISKSTPLPKAEEKNLSASLARFLENQTLYQSHNKQLAAMTGTRRKLELVQAEINTKLNKQRKPARKAYNIKMEKHRLWIAFLQLLVLIPLLAIAGYFILKKREDLYFPLYLGFGGATLFKVAMVIHEYFPSRYFKYILTFILLFVVGKLLIYFIKTVASPKAQWLAAQYRDAYQRFLCPICEYPIRTGPRKYLFWTRRTVNKILPSANAAADEDAPYACPSCGTSLYEDCQKCHKIRHSLLPNCQHCNDHKILDISTEQASRTQA